MFIDIETIRIFLGETARHGGRPVHEAIVEEARKRGMAGATVFRGVMGFGANSHVHTSKILRLSEDLPMVVEIMDVPERIRAFLPHAQALLSEGVLAVFPGKAIFHLPMRVRDVMTPDAATVRPGVPLAEVVDVLLGRGVKAVPVIENGKPVGIVTGGDLLKRSTLGLRLDIQRRLPPELRDETLAALKTEGLTARDAMTAPAVTVNIRAAVPEAARLMAERGLKRLVVVDDLGEMVGLLSRVDVLRAYARAATLATALPGLPKALRDTAGGVMFRDVPACRPDTPLRQVLDLILSNPLRRVVVTRPEPSWASSSTATSWSVSRVSGIRDCCGRSCASCPPPGPRGTNGTARRPRSCTRRCSWCRRRRRCGRCWRSCSTTACAAWSSATARAA